MATYFDVTRTYLYWHNRHPTGIQRAVYGLCAAGRQHDVLPLVFHPGNGRFYRLDHLSNSADSSSKEPPQRLRRKIFRRLPSVIQRVGDSLREVITVRTGWWTRRLAGRLAALERETAVDPADGDSIYILDVNIPIPSYMSAVRRMRRVHPNLRVVGFVHDIFPLNYPRLSEERFKRAFEKWWRFLSVTCDGFLTNSNEVARSLAPHVPNTPVRAIRFGSALETSPQGSVPAVLEDRQDGWILSVGSHEPRKNHLFLLEALEPLWRSRQLTVPLVLAGAYGVQTDRMKKRIHASPVLREHVMLLGSVPDGQLGALYRRARLHVLPSIYEGFGLTVSEAMQWGCPSFASRAGAIPEVGGTCVEYFDLDGPEQLRALVRRFFSDASFERDMRARARSFTPHTWQDAVEDLLAGT